MAGYLIYVPGCDHVDGETFRRLGLGDLIRDATPAGRPIAKGPDGGRGYLTYWTGRHERAEPPTYNAEAQHWQPAKPDPDRELSAGRFWLGMERHWSRRPHPRDLERRRGRVKGREVVLGDGNPWLVPIARHLPKTVVMRADGVLGYGPPGNPELDAIAARLFASLLNEDGVPEIPVVDGWMAAATFLSINYRVNRDVVDFLGLLKSHEAIAAACCTIAEFDLLYKAVAQRYFNLEGAQNGE